MDGEHETITALSKILFQTSEDYTADEATYQYRVNIQNKYLIYSHDSISG